MNKRGILLFVCLVTGLLMCRYNAEAQTLTVSAPNVVSMDETFRVEFTANGNVTDFNWESSPDFEIVWGPQRGSSSSISIINGKRESTHTETYTYLLQPTKEGKFTIPGASANVSKTSCNTGTFQIEVVAAISNGAAVGGSSASQQGQAQQQNQGDIYSAGTVSGDDLFLKLNLSKTNVVKGEPITASLVLYTRADIAGFEDVKFPTFNGFWSKETYTPDQIEFTRENVNGKIYNSAVLRRYMLIPQQDGVITIDPAEMVCLVRVRSAVTGPRSIFDDFFDNYQTIRKRFSTSEINVNVKELPAGAPASFSGGVGQFKISASANKDSLAANDAASLKVIISGTGNISMLETPKIDFPNDFEVYDVKSSESIDNTGTGGSKTFEYPFIPRSYGKYTIGPIEYSYYDIKAGRYMTSTAPAIELTVTPNSDGGSGGTLIPGTVRQSVKNLDEDIRYINIGKPDFKNRNSFLVTSSLFYIILAVIVLIYFVVLHFAKAVAERRADVVGTKNRKANKVARMRLNVAENYMKQNLSTAFYEELHKAVLGYLSDKLAIRASDLSKENISSALEQRNVPAVCIDSVIAILDDCDAARYSPDQTSEKMQGQFDNAVKVISELEGNLNNRKNMKANVMMLAAILLLGSFAAQAQTLTLTPQTEQESVTKPQVVIPENSEDAWELANTLYTSGEYEDALTVYLSIESEDKVSAPLFYNIANTYYRLGVLPKSILYYERALKLDPGFKDAAENLTIAHSSVLDKIDTLPDFILVTWIRNLKYSLSSNAWAVLSLVLAVFVAVLMLLFKLLPSAGGRKTSFVVGCVMMLFVIGSFLFALSERNDAVGEDSAIVMLPVSSVKSSPDANSKSLFILHEGTKVDIIDNLDSWIRVELSDGRQGWMPRADIEII